MNLFGKKKKETVVQPSQAIQTLQSTVEILEKRGVHLDKQVCSLKDQARGAVKGKQKSKALYYLKKSKMLEKQLGSVFNTKLNLELQIAALTQAVVNTETILALQIGRDVLANSSKKINPDMVADVMDDLEEKVTDLEEISELLGRPVGSTDQTDEELLKEIEEEMMSDTVLKEPEIISAQTVLTMPSIPVGIPKGETQEERELRELEKLMTV